MTIFDTLFYNIFSHYKTGFKQKAVTIATMYVSVLQCLLLLLLGVFFAVFFRKMHVDGMSKDNAWTIFVLLSIFLFFKNWMQYTGKRRMMINTKMVKKKKVLYNIWLLLFLPVAILGLTFILFQAY
ncbi:hypothetical protein APS56_11645 [Pseudalgibacter alginicilyticus]|uniref:Uncharacterized protein n=1 Tax=Pseudalgibacter alginicilyticus TaxID=1736674 RepID=A0A0P0CMI6_9FLAO|nr:hypothetical protein [Pseudalgibacter alginicilyticus]ALJ05737.1 hypothetical protein APS56_11645 [Pseudalgibacter alginicilyticus]